MWFLINLHKDWKICCSHLLHRRPKPTAFVSKYLHLIAEILARDKIFTSIAGHILSILLSLYIFPAVYLHHISFVCSDCSSYWQRKIKSSHLFPLILCSELYEREGAILLIRARLQCAFHTCMLWESERNGIKSKIPNLLPSSPTKWPAFWRQKHTESAQHLALLKPSREV